MKWDRNTPLPCESHFDWLKELDIPFAVKYARRDVIVRANSQVERASVTKIDGPLFGEFQTVDPANANESERLGHCMEPLKLDVPAFAKIPPNASHILLGAATTLDRLDASIPFFERWLPYSNARLFIVVTGPDDSRPDGKRMAETQFHMRDGGMAVTLI